MARPLPRLLAICALAAAAPAFGATSSLPPVYDFGASPFATGPSDTTQATISNTLSHVHGYVSGGVSSRGGSELSAGVLVPVIPGKLSLAVSAGTQSGTFYHPPGGKGASLHAQGYQATLDYHPDPDWNVQLSVSQTQYKLH